MHSCKSTLLCSGISKLQLFHDGGNVLRRHFRIVDLVPARAVPEFRMVVAADDGHVLREAGIVPQILRQENAALRVRLAARRARPAGAMAPQDAPWHRACAYIRRSYTTPPFSVRMWTIVTLCPTLPHYAVLL